MKDEIKRLNWETENEFKYRKETGEIVFNIGKILNTIGAITQSKKKDMSVIKEELKKQYNWLNRLVIPNRYVTVHIYLLDCLKAYVKSSDFLEDGIKNNESNLIYKSGRYINEGNAWMELAKIRIWESIEKAILENNKTMITPANKVI